MAALIMALDRTDFALVTIKYKDGSSHWVICPQEWHLKVAIETYETLDTVEVILIQYR